MRKRVLTKLEKKLILILYFYIYFLITKLSIHKIQNLKKVCLHNMAYRVPEYRVPEYRNFKNVKNRIEQPITEYLVPSACTGVPVREYLSTEYLSTEISKMSKIELNK